jgi:type II secretory pathway component GspD/PulD (secretin)
MAGALLLFAVGPSRAAGEFHVESDTGSPVLTKLANPRLKAPITLWAKDANLSEVLKVLADKSGMNFVAGEGVRREQITIILSKTPLDEAINLLVRAAGLSYEIIGNSVLIAEQGKLKEEVGQSAYVVELKYARAAEVASMLSDLTKNVRIDKGGNRLVCYTSPRVINEIEKVVKSVDHPHILVMLETRLVEVSADRLDQYGIDWGVLSPVQGGISYGQNPLRESFALDNWVQLPMDFTLSLDMLVSDGDARVLMDSKLTTTNNREASLHIGEIVPYTIQSYNLSASGGVNQQIQKEEVGVKVDVTPHVNEHSQITLTLQPEVSSIVGWKGPSSDVPLVRVRTTKTTVRVRNGQTIFLAGLMSEDKTEEIRKLPILGDIPLLGLLFQHRKTVRKKTNLIVEITPKIVRDTDELSYEIESEGRRKAIRTPPSGGTGNRTGGAEAVETLFGGETGEAESGPAGGE